MCVCVCVYICLHLCDALCVFVSVYICTKLILYIYIYTLCIHIFKYVILSNGILFTLIRFEDKHMTLGLFVYCAKTFDACS